MREWTQDELTAQMNDMKGSFAVFIYTPFCGTCQLAERMLEIILTMKPELPLFKSNLNYLPQVNSDWHISSVPCIVIIGENQARQYLYKMQSVDFLYGQLMPLFEKN